MNNPFYFDAAKFSWGLLVLILERAQTYRCSPEEAAMQILTERAAKKLKAKKEAA